MNYINGSKIMYRKQIGIFIAGFLILPGSLCGEKKQTKDNILRLITSNHNLAFGKDNLITERIKPEDAQKWRDLLAAIQAFVKDNAPDLISSFDILSKASDLLLNDHAALFALQTNKNAGYLNNMLVELEELKGQQKKVKKVAEDTKKKPFFEKNVHKEGRDVVNTLALFLDSTLEKVFRDWKKLNPTKKIE